jgi:hypothetical protein
MLNARTSLLAVLAAVALTAGCGAGEQAVGVTTTTATVERPIDTTRPANLGCDYGSDCFPQQAAEALERCPESRLDEQGRTARSRLEKHLERYQNVDLHSERAYETNGAADKALSDLEKACS